MIETAILQGLIFNEEYMRKVVPFLRDDYFVETNNKIIFGIINEYINKYNTSPNKQALAIEVDKFNNLNADQFKSLMQSIDELQNVEMTSLDWLIDNTEKHCQAQAIYNAIHESIEILEGNSKDKTKGSIPELLSDALAVTFDTNIGHDFLADFEKRYDFYHLKENKIEFDIDMLNKITKGGLSRKTLNVLMGGTNVGKSLVMCHMAAANLAAGYNVLYISMEMSEEKIAQRIEANLMDENINDIEIMPRESYLRKIQKIADKVKGKLIIKEFPTSVANASHFRHIINELKLKKNFVPDIVYVDYINICASSRIKLGNTNSYFYVKAIAEELRGLGVEFNVPIVTATQPNRSGFSNSDMEIDEVSESFGLPATADLFLAIITTEEMEKLNQYLFKQLKNRYNDKGLFKRFVVGVDRARMKLYDVENSAQEGLVDDSPVMDSTEFGNRFEEDSNNRKKKFGALRFD